MSKITINKIRDLLNISENFQIFICGNNKNRTLTFSIEIIVLKILRFAWREIEFFFKFFYLLGWIDPNSVQMLIKKEDMYALYVGNHR